MLMLFSLAATLFCLCALWKKRFELLLAPFVCALMLVAYALAMARALSWLPWIALGCGVVVVALTVARGAKEGGGALLRSFGQNVLTPGFLCFALLAALFWTGGMARTVVATDDIHYWAVEARSIFAHGGLVDASRHLSPRFMTYTPGMQLYQWLGLAAYGEWNEGVLYCMLWSFYAVFLLPLTERVRWRSAYWIPVFVAFAVGFPALFNVDAYAMLRVDTALGLCLGYTLLQAWAVGSPGADRSFHLTAMALGLCAVTLIKQVGVAWALMAEALLLFVVKPCRTNGMKRLPVCLACLAPLAAYASWKAFCALNHLSGAHLNAAAAQLQAMADGAWSVPEGLPAMLWSAFTQSMTPSADGRFSPPMIVWVLALVLLPLVMAAARREKKRPLRALCSWTVACFVVFVFGYAVSVMTAFAGPNGENEVILGEERFRYFLTQRYFCPFLIGVSMLLVSIAARHERRPKPWTLAGGGAVALVLAACCGWTGIYQSLAPSAYAALQPEPPYLTELAENTWVDELDAPEDAVVLYGVQSAPYRVEWLQYAVAPAKVTLCAQDGLTREDFILLLKEKRITHIVCMDEENAVYQNALPFAQDEYLDVWTVYTLTWDGDTPVVA